jgi:hypothetical protein
MKQAVLDIMESPNEPDTRPDFIKEIQERKRKLLTVLKSRSSDEVSYEVQEHIRRMEALWATLTNTEKQQYADWHKANIQDEWLKATLIDLVSSPEARKIPITYYRCPKCREEGDNFHASSPKSFRDLCKPLRHCSYQEARDPTVFIMNEITHCEIAMKAFWGSGEQ